MMIAPRIDSTRNLIDDLILLLAEFRAEVHDIHDLAYNRKRAAEEARVAGGSRDFALDTHGDMRARDLYRDARWALDKAETPLKVSIDAIRSHVTQGAGISAADRTKAATKAEVTAAIHAAERRAARSRLTPIESEPHHRISAQPRVGYVEPTVELVTLQNAIRKMARLDPEHVKPDRSRLTPAEQDAWRRATTAQEKAS